MRALVHERYGSPDVLRIEDVPVPSPSSGEVLVKVEATSVNLSDWEGLVGSPAYARAAGGFFRPRRRTLGSDIAGRVESVGADVTDFTSGDEVYGDNLIPKGGFAEYAVVPAKVLAAKPTEMSFVEAACIPQAGPIALQGVEGFGESSRVLINGGGGGSGAFAIQIAKRAGAYVTAVDNAEKLDFMRSVGADAVVDYRADDFTRTTEPHDLILDLVAQRSMFDYRRALVPGGRYRCVGGTTRALLRTLTVGSIIGRTTRRRMGVLAVTAGPESFRPLADLVLADDVNIHVDQTFDLSDAASALRHVGEGRALGKVVVTVDEGR